MDYILGIRACLSYKLILVEWHIICNSNREKKAISIESIRNSIEIASFLIRYYDAHIIESVKNTNWQGKIEMIQEYNDKKITMKWGENVY